MRKLLALAATLAISSIASADTNLVSNGDFEAGFTDWINFDNSFIENIGANGAPLPAEYGGSSMKVFGNFGGAFNFGGAVQDVAIAGGTEYTLSGQAYTYASDSIFGTENDGRLKIEYKDIGGNIVGVFEEIMIDGTSAEDTVLTTSFNSVAPATAVSATIVVGLLQPNFEGGSIFFDNIALKGVPGPSALALLAVGLVAPRRRRR